MTHFQSRTHVILWLENNCARKAITRALYEGQVEFFGGFKPIPPTAQPGWIIRVTSAHGKIWYVAVICYDCRYGIRILRDVPWDKWVGVIQDGSKNDGITIHRIHLFSGDYPEEYKKLWEIWNENQHI